MRVQVVMVDRVRNVAACIDSTHYTHLLADASVHQRQRCYSVPAVFPLRLVNDLSLVPSHSVLPQG